MAHRHEHQRQRLLVDAHDLVGRIGFFGRDFVDQLVDGLYDRRERVFIAGQDHPTRERTHSFLVERVESEIDHLPRRALPRAAGDNRIGDGMADIGGKMAGERLLQLGRGAEMMEQIGMRPSNPRADSLQRDGLWAAFNQQRACRLKRSEPRRFGAQALTACHGFASLIPC